MKKIYSAPVAQAIRMEKVLLNSASITKNSFGGASGGTDDNGITEAGARRGWFDDADDDE